MNTLEEWTTLACGELGIDPAAMDTGVVLDLARDVARGVARPAAPLTAFLLGVAVGQGQALDEASARLTRLAQAFGEAGHETS